MPASRIFGHSWVWLIVLALAVALFAACGGGDDDADSATDGTRTSAATGETDDGRDGEETDAPQTDEPTDAPDDGGPDDRDNPCTLLTPEEIEAVLGGDFGEGELDINNDCTWEDPATFAYVFLSVGGEGQFEGDLLALSMEEFEGPGERAAWTGMFRTLEVVSDGRTLEMQIGPSDILEPKAEAIALMEKVLD